MAYIGREPTNSGQFLIIDDISSNFNSSNTSFNLTIGGNAINPAKENIIIALDGVLQQSNESYAVTGSTISFTEAPGPSVSFYGLLTGESQFIANESISNDKISPTANISGSKINTDFSGQTVQAKIFSGMVSSSAQIATDISGSLSNTAIGALDAGIVSGSSQLATDISGSFTAGTGLDLSSGQFSVDVSDFMTNGSNNRILTATGTDAQNAEANLTFDGSTLSVTGDATITGDTTVQGTLTAQEIHTEFTSASIMFSSGSTKFGDTIDDTHEVTGSMTMSGSVTVNDGNLIVTDNVGIGTNSPDSALHVVAAGSPSIRVTDTTNTVTGKFQTDNSLGKIGTHTNHSFELFSNNTTALTIDTSQKVGIGTNAPGRLLDLVAPSDAVALNLRMRSADDFSFITFTDNDAGESFIGQIAVKRTGNGTGEMQFYTAGNNLRMVIDASGKVGIGASSPTGKLSIAGASGVQSNIYVDNHAGDQDSGNFIFRKSRNTSIGSHTVVQDDDDLGSILFQGSDGNSYETGALIVAEVDGTPGDGDMPGRLVFKTTADGASSASERIRITNAGLVGIGTNNPAKVFHVESSVGGDFVSRIRNSNSSNGDGLNIKTNNTDSQFRILHAENSNGRVFTIYNDAKVLIGNNDGFTASSASLHIAQNEPTIILQDMNHASDTNCTINANSTAAGLEIAADVLDKKDNSNISFQIDGRERMRLKHNGTLCVGPSGSAAGFTPALTVTGTNPSLGLRLQDGNSGTFYNTVLSANGTSIKKFYSHTISFATAANDGGTSESTKMSLDTSGNLALAGNISHDGTITTDITSNNTGHDFRLNADTGFVNSIDNNFDGASAGASYMRFKIASGASSQASVMDLQGDGRVGIGDDSPDGRLTVNAGDNDTGHITVKNSDVAHSFTALFEADTFCDMRKYSNAEGGMNIQGMSEGERGLAFSNFSTVYDTPNNGQGADKGMQFFAYALSGNNAGNLNSNGTAFIFRARRGGSTPTIFIIDEDGDLHADGSTSITGFDYAEMFEWEDGNTNGEDRVGYSVVFGSSGDKIRVASGSEEPIGVVSARPGVIGDNPMGWQGKWKTDEWDRKIPKLVPMVSWSYDFTRGNGEVVQKTFRTEIANTGSFLSNIPSGSSERGVAYGGSIPSNANYYNKEESQLSDDYDETRDYTTRRGRKEWDTIGLMGKLKIRTGQATGSRWIKMKDVSDSIQLWLVK